MKVCISAQVWEDGQKLASKEKSRVFDFLARFTENPGHPSIRIEPINTPSKNIWSGRITRDLRAILFKDLDTWVVVHVGHHDAAYDWAQRKSIGRHSVTGAMQVLESIESVREIERVIVREVTPESSPLFKAYEDDYLVSLGIPVTWLSTLRRVQNEEQLLKLCEALPDEVAGRLIDLSEGMIVTPPLAVSLENPMTEAQDTNRRFFLVKDADGLAAALEAPMARWIAFLHPTQKALVTHHYRGPCKVSGSAGTGKTVVAMHRAKYLAGQGERVLLTSYASALCENILMNLSKICSDEELKKITVSTYHKQALAIVTKVIPEFSVLESSRVYESLDDALSSSALDYDRDFVRAEWDNVLRIQGVKSWDAYRDAKRTGRGKGLSVKERLKLWKVFDVVFTHFRDRNQSDWMGLSALAEGFLSEGKIESEYDAVIIDEVQDLNPPALRFLNRLCTKQELFMVFGDAGQKIYPGHFSLKALGIDVVGRSKVLRLNYRTTEQIRRAADLLLNPNADDMNGGHESRRTESVLRGPSPILEGFATREEEREHGVARIKKWVDAGLKKNAIGVFVSKKKDVELICEHLEEQGLATRSYKENDKDGICVGTLHSAKGLEFKVVLVLGCSAHEMPSPYVLEKIQDPQDREEAIGRALRLLYVAMTRARDELVLSWNKEPSMFLRKFTDIQPTAVKEGNGN